MNGQRRERRRGMAAILGRLTAMCMLAAVSGHLTSDGRMEAGTRMVCGLAMASLMLEAVLALPGALGG